MFFNAVSVTHSQRKSQHWESKRDLTKVVVLLGFGIKCNCIESKNLSLCVCMCLCVFVCACVKEKNQRERLLITASRVPWMPHFYNLSMKQVSWFTFNIWWKLQWTWATNGTWHRLTPGCWVVVGVKAHLWKTLPPHLRGSVSSSVPHAVETLVTIPTCYWGQRIKHMSLCVL